MSTEVTAPMSGSIFKLLVKVGDQVKLEDELLVLEAMKMENPVYAPVDGKIAEIKVSEGTKVQANQVLIVIE
ncbi:MAG: acetyl-CoA carboxylase biotin carboxyl carrier protein subunit [Betaproteobacteria bacterium RIFCSPLOWO2_02_FULL_62_17]|nr:MAG: acetyl-CoA carboxylase biotin carboxyl carrier protein subunit [Betaproteobacteria bacterium RIFCSPLOWO2_02_FULL_62_17]